MSAIKNLIEFRFVQKYPEYRYHGLKKDSIKLFIEEIPESEIDAYTNYDYLKRSDNETLYKIEVREYGYCRFKGDDEYLVSGVCIAYIKDNKVIDIRNVYWF